MHANGKSEYPTVEVSWNREAQAVGVRFDSQEFKNWDFVVALLGMAKDQAETMRRMQQLSQVQKQSAQSIQLASPKFG